MHNLWFYLFNLFISLQPYQLFIRVQDINDNRPLFDSDSYEVVVSENIPSGSSLLTVTATDADDDKRLFYTLHAVADRASEDKFNVQSETGERFVWRREIWRDFFAGKI